MSEYLQKHLGAKLFLSYLVIIIVGVVILFIAGQFVLPAAFNHHMSGMMDRSMMGQNGIESMSQLYLDFRASFNEALIYAALVSVSVAIALSFLFIRGVIAPVQAMSFATQRIADGHYEERLQIKGNDEVAQLATRFNQMAEKLNEVETMRRRLIGDVSHELRTPLTAIKGSMEGLMDGVLPPTVETYAQIHVEADRLNRLVDDLQELSRVEAHAYQLDLGPVNLSPLVQTLITRLSSQAESKHITMQSELGANLPPALADEDRVAQVLTNLTGNALQYTPEDGKILISARRMESEIQVSIQDTGIGIPPEHLPHIFDRFYRVDKSRARRAGGGSGIGLTIARALVEAQGGRLSAQSAGKGQGSTFIFTLPVAK
jgi:signal transduction histidine kinase